MEFSVVFVAAQFPVWVFAIVFCPDVIGLVAGGRYAAAAPACAALLCAAFLRSHSPFLIRQIHFLRETWVLPLISIPCAAFSILATVLLAPTYGITAVGWAVACADTAMLVALAQSIRHYEHLNFPLVMSLALGVVLVALAAWVGVSEPVPADWSRVAVKGLVGVVALLASGVIWIWPRRAFIRQLAAG
jgi:O-antigen/teichoic acid export membrane protein